MKNALAISVGTTALATTPATTTEYCDWSMMPWERPNSAEMVPNVRPVDISSVVYILYFCCWTNNSVGASPPRTGKREEEARGRKRRDGEERGAKSLGYVGLDGGLGGGKRRRREMPA